MAFAQIGPLTELMQSLAAGVGAGMLLGGFAAGFVGLVDKRPRRRLERSVAQTSYIGGAFASAVILADITLRHAL